MHEFTTWLASTPLSHAIQRALWLIVLLQTIHILAVAMVLSSVAMIELRVLGFTRSQTMTQTAHRFGPWLWTGLVLLASTGIPLIIAEPGRTLDNNPAFLLKMFMLAIAVTAAVVFQVSLRRNAASWESRPRPSTVNVLATVTLFLWFAIAVAGRWIAYVREG